MKLRLALFFVTALMFVGLLVGMVVERPPEKQQSANIVVGNDVRPIPLETPKKNYMKVEIGMPLDEFKRFCMPKGGGSSRLDNISTAKSEYGETTIIRLEQTEARVIFGCDGLFTFNNGFLESVVQ